MDCEKLSGMEDWLHIYLLSMFLTTHPLPPYAHITPVDQGSLSICQVPQISTGQMSHLSWFSFSTWYIHQRKKISTLHFWNPMKLKIINIFNTSCINIQKHFFRRSFGMFLKIIYTCIVIWTEAFGLMCINLIIY